MSGAVLALVLLAAVCHAGWNFAARRVSGNLAVLWLGGGSGCLAMTPVAAAILWRCPDAVAATPAAPLCVLATGAIHALYCILLGRAYERGEISVVYPVARGSGIALTALGGMLLLGEPISAAGAAGIAAVSLGILLLAVPALRAGVGHGLGLALGVGATIPAYSLIDKVGVGAVQPVVYIWAMYGLSSLLLWRHVRSRFAGQLGRIARDRCWTILAVGLGAMLTYLLILYAYTLGPVGYIVAARETSVVLGAGLGVAFLGERLTPVKGVGLGLVGAGLVCLRLA